MSQTSHRSSRIIGSGHYVPDRILTNQDLEEMVDTTDEWITARTGIKTRRIVSPDQACSDLAFEASRQALEMAGIEATDLDGIFIGTISGDMPFPATAVIVQDRLGASNAVAMDLSAACCGFIYGANIAHGMITSGQMNRVLVVGAEVLSRFIDWDDRSTCVLFGDGAGAAVFEACEPGDGVLSTFMRSDGSLAELLCIPAGGSRLPLTADNIDERLQYIKMKGEGVFKWAVRAMADSTRAVAKEAGYALEDIDLLIPHQANVRIIDAVVERLGMPEEKVVINLTRLGNTSSATVPIAYDEVVREGRVKPGDVVAFVGFGGGFTWGSMLFKNQLGK